MPFMILNILGGSMSYFQIYFNTTFYTFLTIDKIISFSHPHIEHSPQLIINTNILLAAAFVLGIGIFFFLLFYWFRTMVVFTENENGKMVYLERIWVGCKDEYFEVRISEYLLDQCVTTHLCIKADSLFVECNKGKNICFLLPGGICIRKKIERNMELLLL